MLTEQKEAGGSGFVLLGAEPRAAPWSCCGHAVVMMPHDLTRPRCS
ncbi:hypothetical protein LEMLEM_LOCUS17304 [Lemmus lemmus]